MPKFLKFDAWVCLVCGDMFKTTGGASHHVQFSCRAAPHERSRWYRYKVRGDGSIEALNHLARRI